MLEVEVLEPYFGLIHWYHVNSHYYGSESTLRLDVWSTVAIEY